MPPKVFVLEGKGGSASPPAIIILFGWLGAPEKHLMKYGEMYRSVTRGIIIGTTASPLDIMLRNDRKLCEVGIEAFRKASSALHVHGDKAKL